MQRSDYNFFQPIISFLGLVISLVITVLPVFNVSQLKQAFLDPKLSTPVSFFAFIIGIIIIWQIMEFHSYIEIRIGKKKMIHSKTGEEYFSPRIVITHKQIIWILIILSIISSFTFMFLKEIKNPALIVIYIQSFLYLVFFLLLISIFGLLIAWTRGKYKWTEEKENFPNTIFNTLEKCRHIKPGIEIYENITANPEELEREGITGVFGAKRIKVRTTVQEDNIIEFYASGDGKEIFKITKKHKIEEEK